MSKVRFAEMNGIDSVLADYVIQTIRRGDPELHKLVLRQLSGRTLRLDKGLGQKLDEFFDAMERQQDLQRWSKQMNERANGDKFQKEHNARQMAEVQKAIDRRLGVLRLEQFSVEQNLVPSASNTEKVADWIDENAKGYWSASNIDAAISTLGRRGKNTLTWAQPAPPAPKPQPTVWSPGQPLPDNATEAMLRAASLKDVKEWAKRKQGKSSQHSVWPSRFK
jgi:hypothetical protein